MVTYPKTKKQSIQEPGLINAQDHYSIIVNNVSKIYHLYERPEDRLKQSVISKFQKWTGRPASRNVHEFWALKDVNFEIKRGETVGIIGRNGSGKSTLLQMLCGTLTPSHGHIQIHGRIAALLELGSGFNPNFTGRENIFLNAAILGLSEEEIDRKFDDIVSFADIGEFIDKPINTYSSGMVVRLAFSVISHVDADILIIDEALAVGDAFFTQKCFRFLRSFSKRGTLIFVSHDTSAVLNLCDRAILLNNGQIDFVGAAKNAIEKYLAAIHEDKIAGSSIAQSAIEHEKLTIHESITQDSNELKSLSDTIETKTNTEVIVQEHKSSFTSSYAKIVSCRITDLNHSPVVNLAKSAKVILTINATTRIDLDSPIIGFRFTDRLGQVIFGQNTYEKYKETGFSVKANNEFSCSFSFELPELNDGAYFVSVGISNGTQIEHTMLHWVDDIIKLEVADSRCVDGIFHIKMEDVCFRLVS